MCSQNSRIKKKYSLFNSKGRSYLAILPCLLNQPSVSKRRHSCSIIKANLRRCVAACVAGAGPALKRQCTRPHRRSPHSPGPPCPLCPRPSARLGHASWRPLLVSPASASPTRSPSARADKEKRGQERREQLLKVSSVEKRKTGQEGGEANKTEEQRH